MEGFTYAYMKIFTSIPKEKSHYTAHFTWIWKFHGSV